MIRYKVIEGFPSEYLDELGTLLTGFKRDNFTSQFEYRKKVLCCFAWNEYQLVGCKIGFQDRPGYFLSATGEVHPDYRKQGIATKLLQMQHRWCIENEFWFINTYTGGSNTPMLILNLKAGFEICGFQVDRHEIYNVTFQKQIREFKTDSYQGNALG